MVNENRGCSMTPVSELTKPNDTIKDEFYQYISDIIRGMEEKYKQFGSTKIEDDLNHQWSLLLVQYQETEKKISFEQYIRETLKAIYLQKYVLNKKLTSFQAMFFEDANKKLYLWKQHDMDHKITDAVTSDTEASFFVSNLDK